jgi:hypothetical protein
MNGDDDDDILDQMDDDDSGEAGGAGSTTPVTPHQPTPAGASTASPALPTPMTLRFDGDTVTSAPATLTKDDATAIANLLRSKHDDLDVIPNSFFNLMSNNSTASGNVSTKASLFGQGVHSSAGALHTSKSALAREADYYEWPIPGTKQKIPVPILKDLDQIPRWQVLLNGVFEKILNIVNALPTDINPFHGLTDEEATKRIMTLFDPKLLISELVKLRLSDLVFDGTDFKLVSSKDVFDALRERGFQLASKTTSRQMVEKINKLRMANTTFSGMVRGFTVVRNFENLWISFTDVFSKHLFTQWEGTAIPTQLLIPLVEPVQLRRFLIERLYLAINSNETVTLFGLGPTPISLADTRTVYKFAVAMFHGIDMIMKTNSNYLESLTTENEFSRTFIPDDTFWKMQFSPHEKSHNRVAGSKRNADGTVRKDPKTNDSGKTPSVEKGSAPENPVNPTAGKPSTGGKSFKNADKTPGTKPSGSDGAVPGPDSKIVLKCVLCKNDGHRSIKCKNSCFCGKKPGYVNKPTDKPHDPFLCPANPRRIANAAKKAAGESKTDG